jgi:hypothetical protein
MERICWSLLLLFFLGAMPAAAQKAIDWDLFSLVGHRKEGEKWLAVFDPQLKVLDGKQVVVEGFIMPLDATEKQRHFILSALPLDGCNFCAPGSPWQMIEVKAPAGVKYGFDQIRISGKLTLMEDINYGLYYLLTEAVEVR